MTLSTRLDIESAFSVCISLFFFFFEKSKLCFSNGSRALFMRPVSTSFNDFFIKNESYGTFYTFKNDFTTVFQFSVFKWTLNGHLINKHR